MSDSHTDVAVPALCAKQAYEDAINLSQHVPQAKTISEMVLDAFQSAKESDQIRELRTAIRQAHDRFDDDQAYAFDRLLARLLDGLAASLDTTLTAPVKDPSAAAARSFRDPSPPGSD